MTLRKSKLQSGVGKGSRLDKPPNQNITETGVEGVNGG